MCGAKCALLPSLRLPRNIRFSPLSFWRVKSRMRIFNGRGSLPLTPELFQGQPYFKKSSPPPICFPTVLTDSSLVLR